MENIVTEKQCCKCKEIKNLDSFSFLKDGKYKRSAWCKKCHSNFSLKWNKDNPEKAKAHYKKWAFSNPESKKNADHKSGRKYRLKTEYGITEDEYDVMLENQKGLCAICGSENNGRRLHVDHNHNTNKVRALLCGKCNQGIGLFNENINFLQKAIDYLRKNESILS